jgi:hypothetical protein
VADVPSEISLTPPQDTKKKVLLYSDGLRAGRSRGRSSSPDRGRFFSFPRRRDRFWAHPASYPMGTGGFFARSKAAGA